LSEETVSLNKPKKKLSSFEKGHCNCVISNWNVHRIICCSGNAISYMDDCVERFSLTSGGVTGGHDRPDIGESSKGSVHTFFDKR
jgi:hypothetical protein